MKIFIRSMCFLLVMITIFTVPVSAQEQSTWSSSYFAALQTYICRVNETGFQIWFDVTATRRMEKLGVSEIQLQESVNNAQWTTVKTYTLESYPQMQESNTASCVNYVSYIGSKYYFYRACVTFYAKNSTGQAEMELYTSPVRLD